MRTRFQGEPLQTLDPEIEATIRQKNAKRRRAMAEQQPAAPVTADQMRHMQQQLEEMQRRFQEQEAAREADPVPINQMFTPVLNHGQVPGPGINANNFELKSGLVGMVQQHQYGGLKTENPNAHLQQFLEVCSTIKMNGVSDDAIRLRLFSFSLRDAAKDWYHSLDLNHQVCIFYNGCDMEVKRLLDASAGGSLLNKGHDQAVTIIEDMATNSYQWTGDRPVRILKRAAAVDDSDPISKLAARLSTLNATINSRFDAMARPGVDNPMGNTVEDVNYINQRGSYDGNNYRGGNQFYQGNRSNLSYENPNSAMQPPPGFSVTNGVINEKKKPKMDDLLMAFMGKTDKFMGEVNTTVNPKEQCNAIHLHTEVPAPIIAAAAVFPKMASDKPNSTIQSPPTETIVPKLKESLSLTLKHFFPLAGNIVYPLNSDELPVLRYNPADSVSLTICESSDDFYSFVANHARDADKFYDLIPQLPPLIEESDHKLLQVLALKVTLFPGRGVCIGVANHHSAGDAASITGFIRSWASINKLGGEREFLESETEKLPVFDRNLFKYPKKLDSIYWEKMRELPFSTPSFPLPTNRVRATYVLSQSELEKLKRSIQSAVPGLSHVSSFVAMAAYVWSCFVKSCEEEEEEDHLELLLFAVDIRARLDPPVPGNYFGNCLSYGMAKAHHNELGFFAAAEAVVKGIRERVREKKKLLEDAENWIEDIVSARQQSILSVAGSARVDLYGADFGWGKARKLEFLSIDSEKYAFSLSKSRDFEGGLEIGMSLPKLKMDGFADCFALGINNL
ncbi:hypothetical protein C2S52_012861 [Perilla frutescens var. hirtella]|nr:hypothetical protein C2S52_012861 [Perilla frutescens var. hirtella]